MYTNTKQNKPGTTTNTKGVPRRLWARVLGCQERRRRLRSQVAGQPLRTKQGQPLHKKHHSKDQLLSVPAATFATAHLHLQQPPALAYARETLWASVVV